MIANFAQFSVWFDHRTGRAYIALPVHHLRQSASQIPQIRSMIRSKSLKSSGPNLRPQWNIDQSILRPQWYIDVRTYCRTGSKIGKTTVEEGRMCSFKIAIAGQHVAILTGFYEHWWSIQIVGTICMIRYRIFSLVLLNKRSWQQLIMIMIKVPTVQILSFGI